MAREKLSSRLGFILLSAGCAIGLGNVWRFPYITGRYGGAAFVLLYLLFLVFMGVPVMIMEFAIGRAGRMNIVGALKKLEPEKTKWHGIGYAAIAGNYLLLMYYSTITGWLLYYFFSFLSGRLNKSFDTAAVETYFSSLTAAPGLQIVLMGLALLLTAGVVIIGLKNGVEKITKVMMVILFVLMLILAIHSCLLPNAGEGIAFYMKPDFGNLVHEYGFGESVFAAMGQAFFTLSLGIGAMTIFGSYFDRKRSLGGESIRIICLDTTVALLSGFIIFPACASFGVEAGSGPSLLFISLPNVFTQMGMGGIWGAVFFLAMIFAALSTLIAVFENISAYWMDMHGWSRRKAAIINFIALFVLSFPAVLGYNVLSDIQPLGAGSTILDGEDFLVSNIILPLGSLAYVIFCSHRYGWGWDKFIAEANTGEGLKVPTALRFYCAWILPLIIAIISVNGIVTALI